MYFPLTKASLAATRDAPPSQIRAEGPLAFAERLHTIGMRGESLQDLLREYASLRYAFAAPPLPAVRLFARAVAVLRVHAAAIATG